MTKIKKSIGHDRLSISAKLASGASLTFSIGRSGERLGVAFSNDPKLLNKQVEVVKKWLAFRTNETNADRFNRLERVLRESNSGSDVVAKMLNQA